MQRSNSCLGLFTTLAIAFWLAVLALTSCSVLPTQSAQKGQENMANPAAVNCLNKGGKSVIRDDPAGGSYGVCVFPDQSECDEWSFFRGTCQPGQFSTAPTPAHPAAYINTDYGFSFNPPLEWRITTEMKSVLFQNGDYELNIRYGWDDDAEQPSHAAPAGLTSQAGEPAALLGVEVPKQLWLNGKQVQEVDYGPQSVRINHLVLAATLSGGAGNREITPEIITQADQILATFQLLTGEAPEINTQ